MIAYFYVILEKIYEIDGYLNKFLQQDNKTQENKVDEEYFRTSRQNSQPNINPQVNKILFEYLLPVDKPANEGEENEISFKVPVEKETFR